MEVAELRASGWKLRWETRRKCSGALPSTAYAAAAKGLGFRGPAFQVPLAPTARRHQETARCTPTAPTTAKWLAPIYGSGTHTGVLSPYAPLSRACLSLAQPPVPSMHAGVWQVVCMAALSAMAHGRQQVWRLHHAARQEAERAAALTKATYGPGTLHFYLRTLPPPLPPLTPASPAGGAGRGASCDRRTGRGSGSRVTCHALQQRRRTGME